MTRSSQPRLTCYDLGPGVTAFSTTRHGGCSGGAYGELNVNPYCGDLPECVAQNRRLLVQALGLDGPERLVLPHQTHGTEVCLVTADFLKLSPAAQAQALEGVDALMTSEAGLCIGVSTADCIPIIIYDPEHHAASVVHAGWRGTVARIATRVVAEMAQAFQSRPARLRAVIGPGISLKNFEVGDEVYLQFSQAGFPMEQIARREDKWHIDLPACNRLQLEQAGVPAASIAVSGICTFDRVDDYFSARRLGVSSGRIYTGIVLR